MSGDRPSTRRHLLVLGVLIVALISGTTLVLTGRNQSSTAPATTVASPLLRSLGTVASTESARALVAKLDPVTLAGAASVAPTTSSDPSGPGSTMPAASTVAAPTSTVGGAKSRPAPTEASATRCSMPLQQQTTDRALGSRLVAASLDVAGQWALVVSYRLPASGKQPVGTRIIVADALSCRVLLAISE